MCSCTERTCRGLTFIELLVTLVILSILATMALPFAEKTVQRTKELELKQALRDVRTSIDRFHDDWLSGKISKTEAGASEDGYPRSLQILVEGVVLATPGGGSVRYLRKIPSDPFSVESDPSTGWRIRGYRDELDSPVWDGRDVYDVISSSDRLSLAGTKYNTW